MSRSPTDTGGVAGCTVLHVDMDAYFAAVEVLDDPTLTGKAVIVGGDGRRGVVASCTYEARAYGVRSAMSSVEARRRCPQALFVPGRYWRYSEVSEQLHEIFAGFTPVVEPIGLDEAFLDVAGSVRRSGAPDEVAWAVRAEVKRVVGLDCSVGVARTKLLAKLASEAAKPLSSPTGTRPGPGVVVIEPDREIPFLHSLPIRALWGVGPATGARLQALGITTVAELAAVPEDTLCRAVGEAHGRHLARLARGQDDRPVESDRELKSVGHEETFAQDLHDHASLHGHAVRMADSVVARMHEAAVLARTINIKIRYGDRTTITRSHSLPSPTDSARAVRTLALSLLDAVEVHEGVRLLGVSTSNLCAGAGGQQLSFDDMEQSGSESAGGDESDRPAHNDQAWSEVEAAVTLIRARYGQEAVAPAALVRRGAVSVKRRGDTQWGPSDQDERSR